MPTVTLNFPDGTTRTATVSDDFKALSPEDQVKTVEEMVKAAGATTEKPPAAAPQNGTEGGFFRTLKAGVSQVGTGLADTADVVGQATGAQWLRDAGKTVRDYSPAMPQNYRDPVQGAKDAWNAGNYGTVATEIGRAGLQGLPAAAAALAAAGLGGPATGTALAGGTVAATQFGPNVRARQAADGREGQDPTAGDLAAGGATTAVQALTGGLAARMPGVNAIASVPLRVGAKIAGEGVENMAQDVVGQVGTTAGTKRGLTVDPAQALINGASGLATRGMTMVPAATGALGGAIGDRIALSGVKGRDDPDLAASRVRVADQIEAAKAESTRPLTNAEAANKLRETLGERIAVTIRQLRDSGEVDSAAVNSALMPLLSQARRHNQDIGEAAWDAKAAVMALGLPEATLRPLIDTITDLNFIATASRNNRGRGPFQVAGDWLGTGVAMGTGLVTGNPIGAAVGALTGHSIGGRIGAGVGSLLDRSLGLREPDVIRQAVLDRKFLSKIGRDPGKLPMEMANDLVASTGKSMRERMGLADLPADLSAPPTGVMDPATGKPFAGVLDAIAHATRTGEDVVYTERNDIAPAVMTAEQAAKLLAMADTPTARPDGYHSRRLVEALKAERAKAEKQKLAETEAAVQAMRDQETMDAAAARTASQTGLQTGAALRQKGQQDATARADAATKEAAFRASEEAATRARAADEAQASRVLDAQARAEAQQGRQTAAATRGEITTRASDLAALARSQAALQRVQQKDAANADRALTRNERAADSVSGIVYRRKRASESDAEKFARTGGMEGSPEGQSDPLAVRANGDPVAAARAATQTASDAPTLTAELTNAKAVPRRPQEVLDAVAGGKVQGGWIITPSGRIMELPASYVQGTQWQGLGVHSRLSDAVGRDGYARLSGVEDSFAIHSDSSLTPAQTRAIEALRALHKRNGGAPDNFVIEAPPGDPVSMARAASRTAPGARKASSATTLPGPTPEAAQPPSQAPSWGPAEVGAGIVANPQWLSYLRRGLEFGGVDPREVTYARAIEAAHAVADAGLIPRDFATALEGYDGPATPDKRGKSQDPMELVKAHVARMLGRGDAVVEFGGSGPKSPGVVGQATAQAQAEPILRNGDRGPIKYPAKYAAAARDYQRHAETMAKTAEAREGWPELADAIRRMAATETAKDKAKIAQDFMDSLPRKTRDDDARAMKAKRFLLDDKALRKGI